MIYKLLDILWYIAAISGVLWLFFDWPPFGFVCMTSVLITIFLPWPDSPFEEKE